MSSNPVDDKSTSKSILKKTTEQNRQKTFQWDEMNILATYHPPDKTYGHMKIDEPKTPFVFESDDGTENKTGASFTPEDLAARLEAASKSQDVLPPLKFSDPVEEEHMRKFREKRKLHYNEYLAAKLAKESLQNLDDDDEEEEDEDEDARRHAEEAARNAKYNAAVSKMSNTTVGNLTSNRPNTSTLSSKNSDFKKLSE